MAVDPAFASNRFVYLFYPFRFAFQPATGRPHVNDVGQGAWNNAILGLFGTPAGNVTVASGFAVGTSVHARLRGG